ncbi:Esterase/lipase/thioesterase [Trichormus variabilis ATCC 29413]|uniref:Esterase/lipase/thioesterase n=3 Tax=Anabaena variabilis TaxID=264691 RepID=Q3M991_TRIV2|nr:MULTISPECIES: alpha/beta hydrolase [Nostocaceae]ABA22445.1 Esterase/lipase/thioesterase [Trichormus variabilis ATCC 29413]MBC1217214.1 alpha/beta hydrolase [Trichormus variabilis ARAD]MBC1269896.1 alpha/beta hydrolase [Trichormus variabilis FSR]MBC1305242.1 alpha/beta hydrolase [Trichormus variabilis N2B]MBC1314135.1 alpha/beta hydrolase [Trichormus variabilis PNB]
MQVKEPKTTIHPEILELVKTIKKRMDELGHPPISELKPEASRFFYQEAIKLYHLTNEEGVTIEDRWIKRLEDISIPIRVYTPRDEVDNINSIQEKSTLYPILVYFQGGGWIFGNLDSADAPCSFLCKHINCIVVSVQYRQAPEYKCPIPVIDALEAIKWVHKNSQSLGGDAQKIAVGGESAGANLAAVAAIKLRDEGNISLEAQLLITPVTQYGFNTQSYQAGYTKGLSLETMKWFWNHYLENDLQGEEYYASPLKVQDARNLPPCLIVTAEHDPLRDDGLLYAQYLQSFQVKVKILHYESFIHSFIRMIRVIEDTRQALYEIAINFREMLYFY